jgi:hypothetical protein
MPFQKGRSGNPKGRPKGIQTQAKLRKAIEAHVPAIIDAMVEKARAGDVGAAKLLVDRVIPALRPTDQPAPVPLPHEGLAQSGQAILVALGAGELTPQQGAALLGALSTLARVVETDELVQRVAALEGKA